MQPRNFASFSSRVLIGLLFLGLGCSDDKPVPKIDPGLAPYLDRFLQEAKARNVTVDVTNIIAEFITEPITNGLDYCGQYIDGGISHIQITNTLGCWVNQTDMNKEILVFHELGHALLKRPHDDGKLPNGRQRSIMNSYIQFGSYIKYGPDLRKYYLDELFNSNTAVPAWASVKTHTTEILLDSVSADAPWTFTKSAPGLGHTGSISNTIFLSSHHSLVIQSPFAGAQGQLSFWTRAISPTGIAVGSELVLKVKIKLVDVTGGVYVALRADASTETALYKSSQGVVDIKGTKDFAEYTTNIQYFPEQIQAVYIMLILDGPSTGTVYFDDIQLINNY